MHIPDGYLSPIILVGMGMVTVPTWAMATRRVQRVLTSRTIPLLAIFAAMAFTIMMFNVPVPGGTTAHGVGGTLIAIVLGPWAAVIAISVALIIQALFFGDGGVLAIFVNCLNMGIILPFTGYAAYRVIAGRSPILSSRRAWAAGIGAYVGITVAALAVGIELGAQPALFSENGRARDFDGLDILARRNLIHDVEHEFFQKAAQGSGAGSLFDRLGSQLAQRIRGEREFNALHRE